MIAKTALERAGIRGDAHQGAQIFRHSLATELLGSGATLSEIGQLLRHKSHDTTRIYAKVDSCLHHFDVPALAQERRSQSWRNSLFVCR